MRTGRDFFANSPEDQAYILENTWCDTCDAPDIGMSDPSEYEEGGRVFVEGRCVRCGNILRAEIVTKQASE